MNKKILACCVALQALGAGTLVQAQDSWSDQLSKAVQDGKADVDFRYRYEGVDQDNIKKDAEASTLRSRVTLQSAPIHGFSALFEASNVSSIGLNDYNSTENGKTQYPVVADPTGTEVKQAWLSYKNDTVTTHGGRQRINQGNQRFVGAVGFRQNEQVYDGFRLEWTPLEQLTVDATYSYKVNRIFGPNDGANPADWEGDNFFLRTSYAIAENHTLTAFGYFLDIDSQKGYAAGKTENNSSDTYGVEYDGKMDWLSMHASFASQSEAGDSNLNYDADYYNVELGANWMDIDFKAGYEVLASDNNVGFSTPLATLHKFQGWADMFLATPGDGIEDAYFSVGGALGPVKLQAIYHDFQAESSGADFGTEIDLSATWPVNKQFSVQAQYASFDTDNSSRYVDVNKAWITLQLKL